MLNLLSPRRKVPTHGSLGPDPSEVSKCAVGFPFAMPSGRGTGILGLKEQMAGSTSCPQNRNHDNQIIIFLKHQYPISNSKNIRRFLQRIDDYLTNHLAPKGRCHGSCVATGNVRNYMISVPLTLFCTGFFLLGIII